MYLCHLARLSYMKCQVPRYRQALVWLHILSRGASVAAPLSLAFLH